MYSFICIAWCKHKRGRENSRQSCKPSTSSRVCMTVSNSPNPSSVYIKLCKHRETVLCCFYKITSSKSYNARKDKKKNSFYWSKRIFLQHQFDNGISQLTNQNLHLKIWSSPMWRVYNSCIFTSQNHVTYSHANTPLGQSERAYHLILY